MMLSPGDDNVKAEEHTFKHEECFFWITLEIKQKTNFTSRLTLISEKKPKFGKRTNATPSSLECEIYGLR